MRKRILSILLVLALCLAYLPVQVHAADYEVSTVTELEALTVGEGDTIRLLADMMIRDTRWTWI